MSMDRTAGRIGKLATISVLGALFVAVGGVRVMLFARNLQRSAQVFMAGSASETHMARMAAHMKLTEFQPARPGDQEKADAIVKAARSAMEPYQDYRKALADGYEIFLPRLPQPEYHFTNRANALAAMTHFDALRPTSLLYKKTSDGSYKLVGVMYTDHVDATEDELNERIPLSIARWHEHVNFCKAPPGHLAEYFGPNAKFGMLGSINAKEACSAAGGTFLPHVFGWMVHVYPYETDPKRIWSSHGDDSSPEMMNDTEMGGMKMD